MLTLNGKSRKSAQDNFRQFIPQSSLLLLRFQLTVGPASIIFSLVVGTLMHHFIKRGSVSFFTPITEGKTIRMSWHRTRAAGAAGDRSIHCTLHRGLTQISF